MTSPIAPIGAISAITSTAATAAPTGAGAAGAASGTSFAQALGHGMDAVQGAQSNADSWSTRLS